MRSLVLYNNIFRLFLGIDPKESSSVTNQCGVKLNNMLEHLQYSVVYFLYKTNYYKTGRGYIYRANQLLSVAAGLGIIAAYRLSFAQFKANGLVDFAIFVVGAVASFIYFERNVSKGKLLKYRHLYPRARITFTVFAFFVGLLLIFLVITGKSSPS